MEDCYICRLNLRTMPKVTLTNATLQFVKVGSKDYVRLPLGQTGFTPPTIPPAGGSWTTTFNGEWEFGYDETDTIHDSGSPVVVFSEYIGARPTGR